MAVVVPKTRSRSAQRASGIGRGMTNYAQSMQNIEREEGMQSRFDTQAARNKLETQTAWREKHRQSAARSKARFHSAIEGVALGYLQKDEVGQWVNAPEYVSPKVKAERRAERIRYYEKTGQTDKLAQLLSTEDNVISSAPFVTKSEKQTRAGIRDKGLKYGERLTLAENAMQPYLADEIKEPSQESRFGARNIADKMFRPRNLSGSGMAGSLYDIMSGKGMPEEDEEWMNITPGMYSKLKTTKRMPRRIWEPFAVAREKKRFSDMVEVLRLGDGLRKDSDIEHVQDNMPEPWEGWQDLAVKQPRKFRKELIRRSEATLLEPSEASLLEPDETRSLEDVVKDIVKQIESGNKDIENGLAADVEIDDLPPKYRDMIRDAMRKARQKQVR